MINLPHPSTNLHPITTVSSTVIDDTKRKDLFENNVIRLKNNSSNNPVFTSERCYETINCINIAKLKCYNDKSDREIALLKTYDVINVGNTQKSVKNLSSSENGTIKYYAPLEEVFDVIQNAHVTIGHRGIRNILTEIRKKYVNISEKQVELYISECHECKLKRSKPKNSSKLVV